MAKEKKIKVPFSTKTDRTKFKQALSVIEESYENYDNDFIIGMGDKFVSIDDVFIKEFYGNEQISFENLENNIIELDKIFYEELINLNNKDEILEKLKCEILTSNLDKRKYVNKVNSYYKRFDFDECLFELEINSDNKKIFGSSGSDEEDEEEVTDNIYPHIEIENDKVFIFYQLDNFETEERFNIKNHINIKKLSIYFPYLFMRKMDKLDRLHYKLYRSKNDKENVAVMDIEYSGFRYRYIGRTLKERTNDNR